MNHLQIPDELKGEELYKFLKTNKAILTAQKKYTVKCGDAISLSGYCVNEKGEVTKGNNPVTEDVNNLNVALVINTTNWMDSHSDVHFPGLWKKSLSENKGLYLLQEHQMTFKGIITDEIKAFTTKMSWQSLGLPLMGETEALVFNAVISKSRNEFMFNEYRMGRVKNHSVGMKYVNIDMAINDDGKYYIEEKDVWDKYIEQVANKQEAIDQGYFWAVTQAKVVEGSAVPIGSNTITPTLENNIKAANSTVDIQPPQGTGETQPQFDFLQFIQETKFINI